MAEGEEVVVVTRNTPTTYYFEGDRASGFEWANQSIRPRIQHAGPYQGGF